jgi:hypothetical protein
MLYLLGADELLDQQHCIVRVLWAISELLGNGSRVCECKRKYKQSNQ